MAGTGVQNRKKKRKKQNIIHFVKSLFKNLFYNIFKSQDYVRNELIQSGEQNLFLIKTIIFFVCDVMWVRQTSLFEERSLKLVPKTKQNLVLKMKIFLLFFGLIFAETLSRKIASQFLSRQKRKNTWHHTEGRLNS